MIQKLRKVLPNRQLVAGDPNPWQLWRWMPIMGPTAHANIGHEELYLLRLYVLRTPWFGLMVHFIEREDWDRDALHDHPWRFWRFIASGSYVEEVAYPSLAGALDMPLRGGLTTELAPSTEIAHERFSVGKFPDGAFHRITAVAPGTVSIVLNGKKSNSWGFFVPGTGKVPWRDYVNGAR